MNKNEWGKRIEEQNQYYSIIGPIFLALILNTGLVDKLFPINKPNTQPEPQDISAFLEKDCPIGSNIDECISSKVEALLEQLDQQGNITDHKQFEGFSLNELNQAFDLLEKYPNIGNIINNYISEHKHTQIQQLFEAKFERRKNSRVLIKNIHQKIQDSKYSDLTHQRWLGQGFTEEFLKIKFIIQDLKKTKEKNVFITRLNWFLDNIIPIIQKIGKKEGRIISFIPPEGEESPKDGTVGAGSREDEKKKRVKKRLTTCINCINILLDKSPVSGVNQDSYLTGDDVAILSLLYSELLDLSRKLETLNTNEEIDTQNIV